MIKTAKFASVWFACLFLICFLFAISGCNEQPEDEHITFLIGVSQSNLIDPWQITLKEDIERQALQYPNVKVLYSDAGGSNEKQENDIADMLVQQMDLIIVFPNDVEYIADVLRDVYNTGTKIILLGHSIEGEHYSARIYADNYKIGNMAGNFAAQLIDGRGRVLEFQGDPGSQMSTERKNGFLDAISAYPDIVKEYVVVGYWSRDNAIEVLDSSGLLDRIPQIDLVYAHNDEMAIGVSKSIESKSEDIFVIGIDGLLGNNRGIEAVKTGKIDATITYPTGGREAMEYAVKLLSGEQIPKEIELEIQLITSENVESF